jgi:hypothetical protein
MPGRSPGRPGIPLVRKSPQFYLSEPMAPATKVIALDDARLTKRDLHLLREIATRIETAPEKPKPKDVFISNRGL